MTGDDAAEAILEDRAKRPSVTWDDILCDVDKTLWKSLLFGDIDAVIKTSSENKKTKQAS